MLSQLCRIATQFEEKHTCRPNILYLNSHHYAVLQSELASIKGLGELTSFLGMEIIVTNERPHPHVAWSPTAIAV